MLTKTVLVLYIVKPQKAKTVETLNSFYPELQLKDAEFVIKNKLIYLLSGLRGFKFVTILVLEFRKIESDDETKYSTFYWNSKAETIIYESDADILRLYQTYKSFLEKIWPTLLI